MRRQDSILKKPLAFRRIIGRRPEYRYRGDRIYCALAPVVMASSAAAT